MAEADRYWLPHPEEAWIVCTESPDGKLKDERGKDVALPKGKNIEDLDEVEDDQLQGIPDIMHLNIICQGSVLKTAQVRYDRNDIYTGLGKILLALNPFQRLDIYGDEVLKKYLDPKATLVEPHCYRLGRDAVQALKLRKKKGQAVLVSGESGAGKTETVKLILNYVGSALNPTSRPEARYSMDRKGSRYSVSKDPGGATGGKADLSDQIMQTNPVLESFGNAKTCRNDNSSRFGKWMQIAVDDRFAISACFIVDYVLELTRVCGRSSDERNYHIFYQLVEHRDKEQLKPLKIRPAKDYNYLKGLEKVPQVNDDQNQTELVEAFDSLNFSSELQMDIFKTMVGILNLGNMKFKEVDADSCTLEDEGTLGPAAEMLGVDSEKLKSSLLMARMEIAGQVIDKPCTAAQSTSRRDAITRLIYGNTFKWLIDKINTALSGGMSSDQAGLMDFLGMLDMAGFESLAKNSLEQMFINLCNEKLQRHFNAFFFDMELQHYRDEGLDVDVSDFTFKDNQPIIDMIHGNVTKTPKEPGILGILDEELKVAKATDMTYVGKVNKAYEKADMFVKNKFGKCTFVVRHFAGEVEYDCDGFMAKNDDKLPAETIEYLRSSKVSVLSDIGNTLAAQLDGASSQSGGKKKQNTVCLRFRESLAQLMAKLDEAQPHFVRCIKPNSERVKNKFTSKLVMDQLLYSGVMELINIHCSGFPEQHTFDEVKHHYEPVLEAGPGDPRAEAYMAALKKLVLESPTDASKLSADELDHGVKIGKTMVFMNLKVKTALEKMRHDIIKERHQKEAEALEKLTNAISAKDISALEEAIAFCEGMRGKKFEPPELSDARDQLEFQRKLQTWLSDLRKTTGDRDKAKLRQSLDEAQEFQVEDLPDVVEAKKVFADIVIEEAMQPPHKAVNLKEALDGAQKAGLTGDSVDKAREALKAAEARDKELAGTRQQVAQAVASRDLGKVADALKAGQEVGLDPDELKELQALHDELQRLAAEEAARAAAEKAARDGLKAAAAEGDKEKIRAAIAQGAAAGLEEGDADMKAAKSTLATILKAEEDRKEAHEALEAAIKGADVNAIGQAVARARQHGVDARAIEVAEQKIEAIKAREKARADLKAALAGSSRQALDQAIHDGERYGVSEEELQPARVILPVRDAVIAQTTAPTAESRETLRECLARASMAPDCTELQSARAMLADLDRKEAARKGMREALGLPEDDPTRFKALRAAMQEVEACGLDDPELISAAKALEKEAHKHELRDTIRDGISRRNTRVLREALCKGSELDLPKKELDEVQTTITRVHGERAELREEFRQALKKGDDEAQARLFDRAQEIGAFTPEQQEKARKDLEKSRARNAQVQRVKDAMGSGDMGGLKAALDVAQGAGITGSVVEEAQAMIEFVERIASAEDKVREAYASYDHTAILKQASAEKALEDAGMDRSTMEEMIRPLKAERAKGFRQLLLMDIKDVGIGDIAKAIIEGQLAGLDAPEVDELRRLFWQKYEAVAEEDGTRFEAMMDDMMPEQALLASDVSMLSLKAEGAGTCHAKSSLATLCDFETGTQLVELLQEAWVNKQGTVLDELESLRCCALGDDGTVAGTKPWDRTAIYRATAELRQRYEDAVENATVLHFPVSMLCMLLYTQHEADLDRTLLFPDCPTVRQPVPLRDAAYSAYREHLQRSRIGQRNACPDGIPCLAGRVTAALSGYLDELSSGAKKETLQKAAAAIEEAPVKLMWGVTRLKETFSPPKIVSRWFPDLGDKVLERLHKCAPGDRLVWVEAGSVTLDMQISEDAAHIADFPQHGVLLEIDGVTEGLELSDVSQYPDEAEFLLPAGTVLRVQQVEKTQSRWLHLQCTQEPSLVQKPFEDACWVDLVLASSDLSTGLMQEAPQPEADEPEAPEPVPEEARTGSSGGGDAAPVPLAHRHIVRTLNHAIRPFQRRVQAKNAKEGDTVEVLVFGEWKEGTVEKVIQPNRLQDSKIGEVIVRFPSARGGALTKSMEPDKLWKTEASQYRRILDKPVKDARSFFDALDQDGNGDLDVFELLNGFIRLGLSTRADREAAVSFLRQLDEDGDGRIRFWELEKGLKEPRAGKRQPRQGSSSDLRVAAARDRRAKGLAEASGQGGGKVSEKVWGSSTNGARSPRRDGGRRSPTREGRSPTRSPSASVLGQAATPALVGVGGDAALELKLKSFLAVFRSLDRRNICAVCHDDFTWAMKQFSDQKDFQKVIRTPAVCKHFFSNRYDLTLHRFLSLVAPPGTDMKYVLRFARRHIKEEQGKVDRSPRQRSPGQGRWARWPSPVEA